MFPHYHLQVVQVPKGQIQPVQQVFEVQQVILLFYLQVIQVPKGETLLDQQVFKVQQVILQIF
ncbi:MAG: hypothetical protein EBV73_05430 [Rhodocyclales bacterium]|nr:hypothetical protein [Rhodocyclales bacterium]